MYLHILIMTCSVVPENVTGVTLMCEVMGTMNKCTVEWDVSGCNAYFIFC